MAQNFGPWGRGQNLFGMGGGKAQVLAMDLCVNSPHDPAAGVWPYCATQRQRDGLMPETGPQHGHALRMQRADYPHQTRNPWRIIVNRRRAATDQHPVKTACIVGKVALGQVKPAEDPVGANCSHERRKFCEVARMCLRKGRAVGIGDENRDMHEISLYINISHIIMQMAQAKQRGYDDGLDPNG